jgi:hypothetical protein
MDRDRFLKDVASHELTISLDNGHHRHLSLKNPKTYDRHFHLTTWPGYLAISGEMGCYVFARTADMFGFFRDHEINPDYWAEKIQASDRSSGHTEFSEEKYRAALKCDFGQWAIEDEAQRTKAWSAIEETLLGDDFNPLDERWSVGNAIAYKCPITGHEFVDFWDHDFQDFTSHYLWCCRAIVWGIAQYDRQRAELREKQQT